MITVIYKPKTLTKHYRTTVNVHLIVENISSIKSRITISVSVSVNMVCAKKLYLKFLQHCK